MKYYVYQLKTSDNEIIYIGKGSGDRMNKHMEISRHRKNSKSRLKNPKLYNKINSVIKSGGYITPEVLFESDNEQECLDKEVLLIKEIGLGNLCNLTEGGEGISGFKLSEETRRKMSEAKKGKKRVFSKEHREKLSKANTGKEGYWKGKNLSKETKDKMSEAKKGKTFTDEHKNNLSTSLTGREVSEEAKKNMSDAAKRRNKKK